MKSRWLVAVVLLVVLGYVWWEWGEDIGDINKHKSGEVAECGKEWFDTHTHLDDSDFPEILARRMSDNGVSCAVIFVQMNPDDYEEDMELYREDLGDAASVYVPFMDVVRDNNTIVTREYLEQLWVDADGGFRGLGEFALYRDELRNTDLTNTMWRTIYEFAGDHELFVMIHVGLDQKHLLQLEEMMGEYPETKFLVHGFELGPDGYRRLLQEYENFYFTLDTATLMKYGTTGPGIHLMYPEGPGVAENFLNQYGEYRVLLLGQAKKEWISVILAATDRVMWGTDVSFDWHTDRRVYEKIIEFSGDIASELPEDVRRRYMYENAVRLFGDSAVRVQ